MTDTIAPAETLRRAAERLEELAEAAAPGPWEARIDGGIAWVALYVDEAEIPAEDSLPFVDTGGRATNSDAAYIALMHPGVGKALAAWLRVESENDDPCDASTPADCHLRRCPTHRALAVARQILGETP